MITHLVHDCFYSVSIALNCLLIALIFTRTPATYSISLLYVTVVELTIAISSLLVFKNGMSTSSYGINAVGGVCRHWGSPPICYYLVAIQQAGISQYAVIIAFCSCFRYYVIAFSHNEPPKWSVVLALLCVHLPTILIYVNFARAPLLKGDELKQAMNLSYPAYNLEKHREEEMLLVTRLDWLATYWIQFIIVPVCLIVFITSVKINAILASAEQLSVNNKKRHAYILKGLIYQAAFPTLYVIAVAVHRAERQRIGDNEELGHIMPVIASIMIALSPIFLIYFTPPYREAMLRVLSMKNSARQSSITSQDPV